MSKSYSAKYYQGIKERLQKKLLKVIKVFLKNKKKKSNKMIAKDIKIWKNKSWLSIGGVGELARYKKFLLLKIKANFFISCWF